jgi:hypothetical protein
LSVLKVSCESRYREYTVRGIPDPPDWLVHPSKTVKPRRLKRALRFHSQSSSCRSLCGMYSLNIIQTIRATTSSAVVAIVCYSFLSVFSKLRFTSPMFCSSRVRLSLDQPPLFLCPNVSYCTSIQIHADVLSNVLQISYCAPLRAVVLFQRRLRTIATIPQYQAPATQSFSL